MLHTISGSNFHGRFSVTVRAPADGGRLSERVTQRISNALCGCEGCTCGGNTRYGDGLDEGSARTEPDNSGNGDTVSLIPAGGVSK